MVHQLLKSRCFKIIIIFILFIGSYIPTISTTSAATRVVEIVNERSEDTRVFRNTDLTQTIDVFPYSVFNLNAESLKWEQHITFTSNKITYVASSDPTSNLSAENQIIMGTDENGVEYRTFMKFGDVLPQLDNKMILHAKIKLYELNNTFTPDYYSPSYKNVNYEIYSVESEWQAENISWENQPSVKGDLFVQQSDWMYENGPQHSWDVTELVTEWYKDPSTYHGVMMKGNKTGTQKSFYKSDANLNVVPVLQITYSEPPSGLTGIGNGLDVNTSKGIINIQWHSVTGATGYKVLFYNGSTYEEIDIGKQTSWSTLQKNLWPTEEQFENAPTSFRLDGSGTELADDPSAFYEQNGGTDKNPSLYYFRIVAYNEYSQTVSDEIAVRIPDRTGPTIPQNVSVSQELFNDFTITWDDSYDKHSAVSYDVEVTTNSGTVVFRTNTDKNEVKIPTDRLSIRSAYKISVLARDNSKNYSLFSNEIIATARLQKDSIFSSYSMPGWVLNVESNPYIKVVVKNEGAEDWTYDKGYELRSKELSFSVPLEVGEVVRSGEEKTFSFYLTGEKTIGELPIVWRMYEPNGGEFGDSIQATLTFADLNKPEIGISYPNEHQRIHGIIPVKGFVTDYQLKEFTLMLGEGSAPTTWETITSSNSNTNDLLFNWNTNGLAKGLYTLRLKAVDQSGHESIVDRKVYLNIPPDAPRVDIVGDNATVMKGRSNALTQIEILANDRIIANGSTDVNGLFSINLPKQQAGTVLKILAKDQSGNTSLPTLITVVDKTAPSIPNINTITDGATIVSGTAEKGATVRIVKGTTVLATGIATSTGAYKLTIPKQVAGTVLSAYATDKAGNKSGYTKITVIDKTPPATPKVNVIANHTKAVTGTTEKYAVVRVKRGTTIIGTATANYKGVFSITIPVQKPGTVLSIYATDKARNTSSIVKKTVVDKIPPAIPTVNKVYSWHYYVKGKAEAYSYVTIKRGSTIIGTARANAKGQYSIKVKPQKKRVYLSITAKDRAGNVSKPRQVRVY
ncbi:hypothetical protein HNQ94_001966 [Salirhabdus euzebyi]|uniref:Uncharacterized protein n=1 Tax=Salirhabdus euzebyi TaxID=394506 RepID=A0A841Q574_9BACI|nr:Ig-like domain-containing protein [Salirhabdus euzebyi]MBB6453517.1 hypothetical protein [Salirhabdus euzebyi]